MLLSFLVDNCIGESSLTSSTKTWFFPLGGSFSPEFSAENAGDSDQERTNIKKIDLIRFIAPSEYFQMICKMQARRIGLALVDVNFSCRRPLKIRHKDTGLSF